MNSQDHSSPSEKAATKPSLIDSLSDKLEYLHVSTTTSNVDTSTAETNHVAWSSTTTRISPSKTVHTTTSPSVTNQVPQSLLQLMPQMSPSSGVINPEQAYFYMNSAYYPQSYAYSSNNYQYPNYIPVGWPNINFMPNVSNKK
jgi:hypothetical protein